jgi:cyanophycinase
MNNRGHLVLIGGAEDRTDRREVLRKTYEINRARNVAVIPTASSYPGELGAGYYDVFRYLGAGDVFVIDVRDDRDTEKKEYFDWIRKSDLIFFTGGDQVKLARTFLGTRLFARIKRRFLQGATLAGTSAGAAVMSNPLIYDGDEEGLKKGTIRYDDGFGFLSNITVDTHFLARERIPRLTQFLLTGLSHRGIGVDEDTAAIISPEKEMEVFGSGAVTVINTKRVSYSNYDKIRDYDRIVTNGVNLGFLQPGTRFNLQYWKILGHNY